MREDKLDIDEYNEIIKKVDRKVEDELSGRIDKKSFGYKHYFDLKKKEILEKEYGIKWKTLQERNEGFSID